MRYRLMRNDLWSILNKISFGVIQVSMPILVKALRKPEIVESKAV
jgi:hypothetical protein